MKKIILFIPLCIVMAMIFQLSRTPHILVSDPSTWFNTPQYEEAAPIDKFILKDHEDGFFRPYENVANREFLLHKLAHIFFFGLLSICASVYFKKFSHAWLFVTAYALFDEIHQSMVVGRSGRALDVVLDVSASLLVLAVLYFLKREDRTEKSPIKKAKLHGF